MNNAELFQIILIEAKKSLVPKLQVGPKKAYRLHTLINWILNLVYPKSRKDSYMKNYTTTIGFTVALASKEGDDPNSFSNWGTLCHEIKHAQQAKKWTRLLFGVLYLFPISLGVALLLVGWVGAIWTPGWWKIAYLVSWLAVTGILFVPQLPDPWRKRWEFQAYSISMHLHAMVYGGIDSRYVDALVDNFHSMAYYIMAPGENKIRQELDRLKVRILMGKSPVADEPIVKIAENAYRQLKSR